MEDVKTTQGLPDDEQITQGTNQATEGTSPEVEGEPKADMSALDIEGEPEPIEKKPHKFTSVAPRIGRMISEWYGSKKMASHMIGNVAFPHTCMNIHEDELKVIYQDLAVMFGGEVSFSGETIEELKEQIQKAKSMAQSYSQALEAKQKEVDQLTEALSNKPTVTETEEPYDHRTDQLIDEIFLTLSDNTLRLSKATLEEILKKVGIAYDANDGATELFKNSVLGFLGIQR